MNFWVHLVIAVLLTVYFLFRFIKDRHIYQILFVLWVPATLLTYVPAIAESNVFRLILGGYQLVMFILVIFFMFRRNPKQAAAMRAAVKAEMKAEFKGEPVPKESAAPDTPADPSDP